MASEELAKAVELFREAFSRLQHRFPGVRIIYERLCEELEIDSEDEALCLLVNDVERFYNALVEVVGSHVAAHVHIFTFLKVLSDELGVDVKIDEAIKILRRRDFPSWREFVKKYFT
ncbi:MAG: hypothetical protein QXZ06_01705 [Candidatus Jordarchaeales archaeon]